MTLTHKYIVYNLLQGTTNGIIQLGSTLSSTNFKEEIIICQHLDSKEKKTEEQFLAHICVV